MKVIKRIKICKGVKRRVFSGSMVKTMELLFRSILRILYYLKIKNLILGFCLY